MTLAQASRQLSTYHWRELPQVSFLSWQTRVFHDKTCLLLQQKYAWHDKGFVMTKHLFVVTSILLSQQKMCFVVTNASLCRQKWYLWQFLLMISAELPCTGTILGNIYKYKEKEDTSVACNAVVSHACGDQAQSHLTWLLVASKTELLCYCLSGTGRDYTTIV